MNTHELAILQDFNRHQELGQLYHEEESYYEDEEDDEEENEEDWESDESDEEKEIALSDKPEIH